jgi:hypothetical protein
MLSGLCPENQLPACPHTAQGIYSLLSHRFLLGKWANSQFTPFPLHPPVGFVVPGNSM